MKNEKCSLYSSQSRSLSVVVFNGELEFKGEDFGEECKMMNGSSFYEFVYKLNKEEAGKVFNALAKQYGEPYCVQEVLKKEFGFDDGSVRFVEFCDRIGASYQFFSF